MDIGRREVLKAGAVTAATAAVRGDQSRAPGGLEILPSKLSNPSETARRARLALGNIATDPNDTTVTVMSGNLAGGRQCHAPGLPQVRESQGDDQEGFDAFAERDERGREHGGQSSKWE